MALCSTGPLYKAAYDLAIDVIERYRDSPCFGHAEVGGLGLSFAEVEAEVLGRLRPRVDRFLVRVPIEDALAGREPRW